MCKVVLKNGSRRAVTEVPDRFIHEYLADANGSYLKLYLLLLHLMQTNGDFHIPAIAERLDWSEADVKRAMNYWRKKGILDYRLNEKDELTHIEMNDLMSDETKPASGHLAEDSGEAAFRAQPTEGTEPVEPAKPKRPRTVLSDPNKERYQKCEEILGITLDKGHLDLISCLHDECHFKDDLLYYLFEYCREIGKTNPRYMETIAVQGWFNNNITTKSAAMKATQKYRDDTRVIMDTFGISGRVLGSKELEYVDIWVNGWDMPTELIELACAKTLEQTGGAKFVYANSILEKWHNNEIHTVSEANLLTQEHKDSLEKNKKTDKINREAQKPKAGSFNDFDQRDYPEEQWNEMMSKLRKWD